MAKVNHAAYCSTCFFPQCIMHDHLKKSVKFRAVEFVCAGMKLVLSYLFSRQGMPFMAWLVMHGSSIIVFQDKTWRDGQRKSGLLAIGGLIHLLLEGGSSLSPVWFSKDSDDKPVILLTKVPSS